MRDKSSKAYQAVQSNRIQRCQFLLIASLALLLSHSAVAQTPLSSAFTYQGQLRQNDRPTEGFFDLEFNLYDGPDPSADTLLATDTEIDVQVSDGLFTVKLDFSSAVFVGEALWLEVGVRQGAIGNYEYISPLQELTAAPNAQFSQRAGDADTLDGLDSSSFVSDETDPTVQENVKDGIDWSEISNIPPGTEGPEVDPTVLESVKDGIEWGEISDIPEGFADGMDDGITDEADPTVLESVKDGVDWTEISNIPDGFADGIDHGITGETDPTVLESVKDGIEWSEISGIPLNIGEAPEGIIVMWSGSLAAIPEGWALCDGNNGAPDLRDRFILSISVGEEPGIIGGSSSHGHSISGGEHTHDSSEMGPATSDFTVGTAGDPREAAQAGHMHHIFLSGAHSHSVGNSNHLPPYAKLAFIMKLP